MALDRIGLHFPGNSEEATNVEAFYVESTGMEYIVVADCDGDLILGANPEDVGLVTWYWATQDDIDKLRDTE